MARGYTMRDLLPVVAMHFCRDVPRFSEPMTVLQRLDEALRAAQISEDIRVLGAWHWPMTNPNEAGWIQGKTVFILDMDGLVADYVPMVRQYGLSPTTLLGRRRSAPYTLTEAMRETRPTGDARWLIKLLRKHGIRDALYCPMVRWTLAYRVTQRIELDPVTRGLLAMAAGAAIGRIEKLKRYPEMIIKHPLTERELELLTLAATGMTFNQIAAKLQISRFTVMRHFRNIFKKLGAKNIAHAVAEALRQGLII